MQQSVRLIEKIDQVTHLRGSQLLVADKDIQKLAKNIEKREPVSLWLGAVDKWPGFPVPFHQETLGFLLMGSPGSGKSTAASDMADQIVFHRKDKTAFLDIMSGDYLTAYYQPGDIILNPFDDRGQGWNIFQEAASDFELKGIIETLIPRPATGDTIWSDAARTVVSETAIALKKRGKATNKDLVYWVSSAPLEELADLLKGTPAASIIDPVAEKTATSVRMNISTYMDPFRYIPDESNLFSIRKWVQEGKGNLFITCKEAHLGLMKPVLTVWVDSILKAVLNLTPDRDRRLFLFLDELAAINQVSTLVTLAQTRKYGLVPCVGIQSISQLVQIYGHENANIIMTSVQNWICFRTVDPATADLLSRQLGKREIERTKISTSESRSTGSSDSSSKNITKEQVESALVLPSEIQSLPDRVAYLNLSGAFPVIPLGFPIVRREQVAEAYVEREEKKDQEKVKIPVQKEEINVEEFTL